jgi:hypothetical protein
MNKIIHILLVLISSIGVQAQNITDAVRWSFTNPGGTARTLGVGGSFGAMGGDFSVVNINPAGIGAYKMSEFTFSPSMSNSKTTSFMTADVNKITKDKYNSFSVDNVSLVIAKSKESGGSAFAIGFSKIADLNKNFTFSGKSVGSITQRFAERANGKIVDKLDDFEAYPAYFSGAIFDLDSNQYYETDLGVFDETAKTQKVDQNGYINELSLAWGGNFNNKFLAGVSLGVPFVSYEETKQYNETDPLNENPVFTSLNYTEYLNTSGVGLNLKAGFIYTPIKAIRIGGAIHTPTWYSLSDDYYTNLEYNYNDGKENTYDKRSPDGSFNYRLNTPVKLVGSLGSIYKIGPIQGFINGDIEWLDYNTNKFDFTSDSDDPSEQEYTLEVNNDIEKYLGSVLNLRLGTEIAYGVVRLRAGVESGDNPVSANAEKVTTTSFGIGVREDKFFIDLGVRMRGFNEGYVPYTLVDSSDEILINNKLGHTRVVMTAGFKF